MTTDRQLCTECGEREAIAGWGNTDPDWLCLSCFDDRLHEVGLRIKSIATELVGDHHDLLAAKCPDCGVGAWNALHSGTCILHIRSNA